jgi:hypothetical protein
MTTLPLRVPRHDTETVKRLGARWDPTDRHWYMPPDRAPDTFAPWLAPTVPRHGDPIPADIVLLPERCYRCDALTAAVAGLEFPFTVIDGPEYLMEETDDGRLLRYDHTSAEVIALVCPDELLAAHDAGPLRWRTTNMDPDGYLANTCRQCGTVLGNFPLFEALVEYETEQGGLRGLPRIGTHIPAAALDWLQDKRLDDTDQ